MYLLSRPTILLALISTSLSIETWAKTAMIEVPSGMLRPFLKEEGETEKIINSFFMDRYPVTNLEFLRFVSVNKKWQKGKVPKVFADSNYLKHWEQPLKIGKYPGKSPVVNISWFAAKAYCESQGKILPNTDQWEYAALFLMNNTAEEKQKLNQEITSWYSKPTKHPLPPVGTAYRNPLGIQDLHGLIWEWTLDFNSALVTGESREDSALNRGLFCGSGSLSSEDKENYPSFMRFAFRSSLMGTNTIGNLGFRCVRPKTIKKEMSKNISSDGGR